MTMKRISTILLLLIAALCILPFAGSCQITQNIQTADIKPWMQPSKKIFLDSLPTFGTIPFGLPKQVLLSDTIPIASFGNLGIKQSAKFAISQPPKTLSIISGKSNIRFSLAGDTMTATLTGSMDSVAQSFIDNVLLQYNQELWKLREFKKATEEQAKGNGRQLSLNDGSTISGITIPPSPGYRESWSLVKGEWTQKENGHFWLMWFDNGSHTSIWVQNYDMKDERFEAMADFISSYGAGDYFWADCCTISTDTRTNISTKSSFNVYIVDKQGQENPACFSTKNATKEDILAVKERIFEFFVTQKSKTK